MASEHSMKLHVAVENAIRGGDTERLALLARHLVTAFQQSDQQPRSAASNYRVLLRQYGVAITELISGSRDFCLGYAEGYSTYGSVVVACGVFVIFPEEDYGTLVDELT